MEGKTLDENRIKEMYWLFSKVIPIDDNEKSEASKIFGVSFVKLIPDLALTLASQSSKYSNEFNGYLEFILQAIAYIREETNEYPNVEGIDEMMKKMKQQIQEFEQSAKPAKF